MSEPTAASAVLDALTRDRWSCRGFLSTPVADDIIQRMLTIAGRAPSWSNTQPWRLTVVSGNALEALRDDLRAASGTPEPDVEFPRGYPDAEQARRRANGRLLFETLGIARDDRSASRREVLRNFDLFDAPHLVVVCVPREMGAYAVLDCGLWIQAFLLAAQAEAIASIPQAAVAGRAAVVRRHLGIPDTLDVLASVAFGYADLEHQTVQVRPARDPIAEIVTFVN